MQPISVKFKIFLCTGTCSYLLIRICRHALHDPLVQRYQPVIVFFLIPLDACCCTHAYTRRAIYIWKQFFDVIFWRHIQASLNSRDLTANFKIPSDAAMATAFNNYFFYETNWPCMYSTCKPGSLVPWWVPLLLNMIDIAMDHSSQTYNVWI